MGRERIGIMGGTFDPIHQGHITMALRAREAAKLDRVLMLPTGNPPHKPWVTAAEERWRMLCIACAQLPELEPSRLEIDRSGTIYTVDTLSILKEKYPRAELFYIIGADTLMELKKWREYGQVLRLCTFLVCPRSSRYTPEELDAERQRLTALGGRFETVDMDVVNVSSTELRQELDEGRATPLFPVTLKEYCRARGLYGVDDPLPGAGAWLEALWQALTIKRFAHTMAVAATARALARIHHLDEDKAEMAGLLHDCAKCLPLKEMQRIARDNHLTEDEAILSSGALLHSVVGAHLARTAYGVTDEEVLQAIASHTTGKPHMTRLDMAVWLADTIEPTRAPYPLLEQVRALADESLEKAMLCSLQGTLEHVRRKGDSIHPATRDTIDWLRSIIKES